MLNTKYIIAQDEEGAAVVYDNPDANGNAWFINRLQIADSANEAIQLLDSINTKVDAVVEVDWYYDGDVSKNEFIIDSSASIQLENYKPNYLKYQTNNSNAGFAVFSENYYGQGWQSYIDGEEVEHIRVNYVLRGMKIPSGNHTIEFKFEPQVINTGSAIALSSSILVGLLVLGGLYFEFRKK